mgnify:CR=1 FL=1
MLVALAAYAASSIAGSEPNRTGFAAMKLGILAFIVMVLADLVLVAHLGFILLVVFGAVLALSYEVESLERLKHSAEIALVRRNRAVLGRRLAVTLAASKDDHRAGRTVDLTMVHADTRRSREVFRAGSFDAIVTDAPLTASPLRTP